MVVVVEEEEVQGVYLFRKWIVDLLFSTPFRTQVAL